MAGIVLSVADFARAAQARSGQPSALVPALATLDARTGRELVQVMVSDVKRRFATGTTPGGAKWKPLKYGRPRGGTQPLRDTGRLMASIVGRFDRTSVTVGTAHPGAALANYGGTVRPRKGKFLAVPLTREAARAGSPRRLKGSARLPLFARLMGGKMVGHFLLIKKAVVPAREFLGLSREALLAVEAVLTEAAVRQWQAGRSL